jgi:hypothetical protein
MTRSRIVLAAVTLGSALAALFFGGGPAWP